MTKHSETRYVSYSPEKMFELVADVEKYPEFLPWCIASRVIEKENSKIIADLMIGFQIFREKFRSNVRSFFFEVFMIQDNDGSFIL